MSANPPDWCADQWCYVDPDKCLNAAVYPALSGVAQVADLSWSYKSCDDTFAGNAWVGYCECTGRPTYGGVGATLVFNGTSVGGEGLARPVAFGSSCTVGALTPAGATVERP